MARSVIGRKNAFYPRMCYSSLTLEGLDMANTTTIEWTDATWNPVTGCIKISKGCDNCYAERSSERFRGTPGHPFEAGSDLTLRPVKRSDSNFLSISVNDANYLRLRPIFVLDVLLDVSSDAQLGSPATQNSFCHYGNP